MMTAMLLETATKCKAAAQALEELGNAMGWSELTDVMSGLDLCSSALQENLEVACEELTREAKQEEAREV